MGIWAESYRNHRILQKMQILQKYLLVEYHPGWPKRLGKFTVFILFQFFMSDFEKYCAHENVNLIKTIYRAKFS